MPISNALCASHLTMTIHPSMPNVSRRDSPYPDNNPPDPDHHHIVTLLSPVPCISAPRASAMRRDVVLAPFSAIVYHTAYAANGLRASRSLRELVSLILQSNSRPPHSFAAQPGVFVVSHECRAMAHTSLPFWFRQPRKTPSPQLMFIPSLRRITCCALQLA
jgi:hypothetical protein